MFHQNDEKTTPQQAKSKSCQRLDSNVGPAFGGPPQDGDGPYTYMDTSMRVSIYMCIYTHIYIYICI